MQQKIQFIITVVHDPELLIFDEPFSGFDPLNTELLKREILDLKEKGKTIIFSTHNMASVEEICDDIALIDRSEVVLSGHVAEIRSRHKKHIFKLTIENEALSADSGFCEVLEEGANFHERWFRVRNVQNLSNSAFLSRLLEKNEILSFEEEVPSMNDIFIQTVTKNSAI
jgi:ABC-2 type transport system ATP-binding protein